ncbi:MAG TPA: murein biosynthesis integral membrane protein MurJ [Blastocatellia bacterium]
MSDTAPEKTPPKNPGTGFNALMVAAGILLSRIAGLVRESIFAHYFGDSDAADAYKAAFRIPNFLATLFGEGVLSASFIPVYANLLARDDKEEARRVAGAVLSLLAMVVAIIVLLGVLLTPFFIDAIAPGFHGEKRDLTIRLVRIAFPGIGLLVLSAWCLGILNSHRRFFLSYAAPIAWNAAIVTTLIVFGHRRHGESDLAVIVSWGAVVGCALQLLVQVPTVLKLLHGLPLVFDTVSSNVRTVVANFLPVFISRGVVQVSAYVDQLLSSLLPTGAVAALAYAQQLSLMPISLFGMSVSAAELPAMSGALGDEREIASYLASRLNYGLRQIGFFVVPSAMAFFAFGDIINGAIYQSGKFTHEVSIYVWGILAGSSVGMVASTLGRLYSSAYYAMRDTRTPLKFAVIRVLLTSALGYLAAFPLPPKLGLDAKWGVAGLTASAGIAAWVEFILLRRTLNSRIGKTGLPGRFVFKLWLGATLAAALGWAIKIGVGPHNPRILAVLVLGPYGITYFGLTVALKVKEARGAIDRALRLLSLARVSRKQE